VPDARTELEIKQARELLDSHSGQEPKITTPNCPWGDDTSFLVMPFLGFSVRMLYL